MLKKDLNLLENINTAMEFGSDMDDAAQKARAAGKIEASDILLVENPLPTGDYRKVIGWARLMENNEDLVPEKRRELASKMGAILRDRPDVIIAMEHRSLETRAYRHELGKKNQRGKVFIFVSNEDGLYRSIPTLEKPESETPTGSSSEDIESDVSKAI